MQSFFLAGILGSLALPVSFAAAESAPAAHKTSIEKGSVRFRPDGDQNNIPERYRLESHTFEYELSAPLDLPSADLDVYRLRFPSPVVTETPENNTVHAEYYRPRGKGPFPGVIVLDIMGGDLSVSRMIATALAQKRVAALCVQMPYYGPRRPAGSNLRMVSTDFDRTMEAIRQTVLDVRRATAWLEARPEIDARRLGVLGTSLGSFMGSLAAEMEPKLRRVAILLGGGGLIDAFYDNPRAAPFRKTWETLGGTRQSLARLIAPADPLTYAANLKDRKVLMIAAKRDEIVPPKMAEAMWKATGQQEIFWYDCTHRGAIRFVVPAMVHVVKHFGAE
jgi:dienelactone hydrolase